MSTILYSRADGGERGQDPIHLEQFFASDGSGDHLELLADDGHGGPAIIGKPIEAYELGLKLIGWACGQELSIAVGYRDAISVLIRER